MGYYLLDLHHNIHTNNSIFFLLRMQIFRIGCHIPDCNMGDYFLFPTMFFHFLVYTRLGYSQHCLQSKYHITTDQPKHQLCPIWILLVFRICFPLFLFFLLILCFAAKAVELIYFFFRLLFQ